MKRILITLLIFSMLQASPVEIGLGVREQGMGGACVALTADAMSIYWNPAGLSTIATTQFTASHWMWQEIKDIMIEYASFAHVLELAEGSKVGVGIGFLSKWAKLEQGNPEYGLNTTSLFMDNTFEVASGIYISRYFQIGLTLERYWLVSDIGGKSGLGFNLGIKGQLYAEEDNAVYYGILIRNILAGLGDEKYYPQARAGLAIVALPIIENGTVVEHYLKITADVAEKEDFNGNSGIGVHYYAGVEITPVKYVSLRAGYNDLYQYSGGIGIRYSHFGIDYAYSSGYEQLGDIHRFGFTYQF